MASAAQEKELTAKVTKLVAERFGGDFAKAFAHYDGDGDGRVDRAELGRLLADAGIGNLLTRGAWASGILTALDASKDGAISAAEFEAVLKG
jgi:Ca2+-binding EF-hand superfamily protein